MNRTAGTLQGLALIVTAGIVARLVYVLHNYRVPTLTILFLAGIVTALGALLAGRIDTAAGGSYRLGLSAVLSLLVPDRGRRAARRAYYHAQLVSLRVAEEFDTATTARQRARLLHDLGYAEEAMARNHDEAWGDHGEDAGCAYGHAEAGQVLHLLASTEAAATSAQRTTGPSAWESVLGTTLDDLARDTSHADRVNAMCRLYTDSWDVLSPYARETVQSLYFAYLNQHAAHRGQQDADKAHASSAQQS